MVDSGKIVHCKRSWWQCKGGLEFRMNQTQAVLEQFPYNKRLILWSSESIVYRFQRIAWKNNLNLRMDHVCSSES